MNAKEFNHKTERERTVKVTYKVRIMFNSDKSGTPADKLKRKIIKSVTDKTGYDLKG